MLPLFRLSARKRAGFTLVEIIIYIGLSAMMVVTLMNVMLTVISTREKTQVISDVQQNLRFVMQQISTTAYDAVEVSTGSTVFGSHTGSLVLVMSGAQLNPTTFYRSGSVLYVQRGLNTPVTLHSSDILITSFYLNNRTSTGAATTVNIQLSASDNYEGTDNDYTDTMSIESTFSIRR